MVAVHPTAIIERGAELESGVTVGPYAVVGSQVVLESGVELGPHAVLMGRTRIGQGTRISAHACLGGPPQHLEFDGENAELHIGRENVIREHVSIHVGTEEGDACTRIGDQNLVMNGAHIAHDCRVGSGTVIASFSGLAGHAVVEDYAVLGAYTGIHQWARVGESAMTAAGSKLSLDAPPFSLVAGDRARLVGLNTVGLARRAFPELTLKAIKRAHRIVFAGGLGWEAALSQVDAELSHVPEVERWATFLRTSERGVCRSGR